MPSVWDMDEGQDADTPVHRTSDELTDVERDILELERSWFKYAGAKETAIRARFDMSATRYAQVLNALVDRHAALMHDPQVVRRLQRLRSLRRSQRTAHTN